MGEGEGVEARSCRRLSVGGACAVARNGGCSAAISHLCACTWCPMKKAGAVAGLWGRAQCALVYRQQASMFRQQAAKSPQQSLAANAAAEVPSSANAAENLKNLDVMVWFPVSN